MIDYLILGGGSAGCVLTARLSEDAGKTVCLVEAGRDISQANMPAAVRSRYPGRAYLDTIEHLAETSGTHERVVYGAEAL